MRYKVLLALWMLLQSWGGSGLLLAQQVTQDVVYLKNGAIIKGAVKEYEEGKSLTIDIGAGRVLTFTDAEILRVERFSQEEASSLVDWITLFNGSQFKGKIRNETPEGLILELSNGEQIEFTAKEIKEIWRNQRPESLPAIKAPSSTYRYIPLSGRSLVEKAYAFREKGWYHSSFVAFAGGRNVTSPLLGIGLHHVSGFQFNRLLGAGMGVGFDMLDPTSGERILSVYGEGRSFLVSRRHAPYISLSGGYGFALRDADNFITAARGGFRLHPAFGWRLGASKGINLAMDLGYIFQSASFTKEFPFFGPHVEVRNVDYRRLTLRVGMMF